MTTKIPNIVKAWSRSISERNPNKQLGFYSSDAVLLPTYDNLLVGDEEIRGYFVDFLDKQDLECVITENVTQIDIDRDSMVASGLYTFSFLDEQNVLIEVDARYTFVINGNKIITHHSSVEPK